MLTHETARNARVNAARATSFARCCSSAELASMSRRAMGCSLCFCSISCVSRARASNDAPAMWGVVPATPVNSFVSNDDSPEHSSPPEGSVLRRTTPATATRRSHAAVRVFTFASFVASTTCRECARYAARFTHNSWGALSPRQARTSTRKLPSSACSSCAGVDCCSRLAQQPSRLHMHAGAHVERASSRALRISISRPGGRGDASRAASTWRRAQLSWQGCPESVCSSPRLCAPCTPSSATRRWGSRAGGGRLGTAAAIATEGAWDSFIQGAAGGGLACGQACSRVGDRARSSSRSPHRSVTPSSDEHRLRNFRSKELKKKCAEGGDTLANAPMAS